jgi:hypothetical protein
MFSYATLFICTQTVESEIRDENIFSDPDVGKNNLDPHTAPKISDKIFKLASTYVP